MRDMSFCYVLAVLASVALLVWGLMDIMRQKLKTETTETQVISRQIRGFGLLLLSQIVLILGAALCFGANGSVDRTLQQVGKLF